MWENNGGNVGKQGTKWGLEYLSDRYQDFVKKQKEGDSGNR